MLIEVTDQELQILNNIRKTPEQRKQEAEARRQALLNQLPEEKRAEILRREQEYAALSEKEKARLVSVRLILIGVSRLKSLGPIDKKLLSQSEIATLQTLRGSDLLV